MDWKVERLGVLGRGAFLRKERIGSMGAEVGLRLNRQQRANGQGTVAGGLRGVSGPRAVAEWGARTRGPFSPLPPGPRG